MEKKDLKILKAIAELGTGSPEAMSEKLSIPKSTIHYRINKLKEEGIIKNELFDIDYEKLGLSITVISEVMAEYDEGYHDEVGKALSNIEGVNQVFFTMGGTDFIVISRLASRGSVENLIDDFERINEVKRTNSKFVIKTIKDDHNILNSYEINSLFELLNDN